MKEEWMTAFERERERVKEDEEKGEIGLHELYIGRSAMITCLLNFSH